MVFGLSVVGCSSSCGKSLITAIIARYFAKKGLKVSPFKVQNMSLNSYPAINGGEIALAQAMQAYSAFTEPLVEMNPILIKPLGENYCEVIVKGRSRGVLTFQEYWSRLRIKAWNIACRCFNTLLKSYDLIITEGAGSVAEPNFIDKDIANLRITHKHNLNAILVVDINRGGAFASIIGTLRILPSRYRRLIRGIIINKFRGSCEILKPAIDWLERKTGIKVLGVMPYLEDIHIWPEDSENLEGFGNGDIDVAVIAYPYISNFNDLEPLKLEPDVSVRIVRSRHSLGEPDIIILPGSRNVFQSLEWLKKREIDKIINRLSGSCVIIGICGGFQILTRRISDPYGLESNTPMHADGLKILDLEIRYGCDKIVAHTLAEILENNILPSSYVKGYEIRRGRPVYKGSSRPLLKVFERNFKKVQDHDGGFDEKLHVIATSLHGFLNNVEVREIILNTVRKMKRLPTRNSHGDWLMILNESVEKFLKVFKENFDVDYLEKLIFNN